MAAKRVRSDAKSPRIKKRAKKIIYGDDDHRISQIIYGDDDRISQLPDDILLQILCCLSLKEAVTTSVLSSRWLNLWRQMPCLNFDKHSCLKRIPPALESCRVKRKEYVKWVNRILGSHAADTLKEFRLCLNLSRTFQKEITQWLRYALVRHVQRLEFDLTLDDSNYIHCSFPKVFFTQKYSSKIDFKSLKVLSLKSVDVTNEDIGFFVSNCPSLEELAVDRSYGMSNLEVCGPSLVLKHLEFTRCCDLESIKISAPNLASLTLPNVVEVLENVPKLVEVYVGCEYNEVLVEDVLHAFSCYLFQLEALTMELRKNTTEIIPSTIVELPKLKKLVVKLTYEYGFESLMGLTTLINASPYLQEFCLELTCLRPSRPLDIIRLHDAITFPHEHLKVFKLCGYCSQASEVDILTYIVVNCVALEKVVIVPCYMRLCNRVPHPTDESIKKQAVKNYVHDESIKKQVVKDYVRRTLEAQVPRRIELVVL